jgi:hypothetical protein
MAFCIIGQAAMNAIILKHFEAIGMDGSSNEMLRIAFGFTVDELEGF